MRARLAGVLLAATVLVTGCSGGSPAPDASGSASPSTAPSASTSHPAAAYQRYVALGDSYSAGPLIPLTDLAGGCARSDHNYAHLVARRLHVGRLVDVTCSAATTRDLTHVQATFGDARIPPQLRAVTASTNLVTIGIGGNDLDLFGTLISTCTRLRASDPTGSPCARRLAARGSDLAATTRTISTRVRDALRAIHHRAPHATVVLVGYLRLVPSHGTCAGLPLAAGDYAEGRRISLALDDALHRAARGTDTRFVDMYAASRGHDICSTTPWVNGQVTRRQQALAYHPFASGMRADATGVLAALHRR